MTFRLFLSFLLITSISTNAQSIKIDDSFFLECDSFFKKQVSNSKITYSSIKQNPAQLFNIVSLIDNADISALNSTEQLAFYINAYNINVIKNVILNYPVSSVMDISGFFEAEKIKVAGKEMTLNHLENKIIRPEFNEPRIHFVLVCGAVDCPPIINEAYTPENLEELLTRQTQRALNNPNFLRVNGNQAELSQIFNWYPEDFGKGKSGLIKFINQYRDEPLSSSTKISYYPYDWSLNIAAPLIIDSPGVKSPIFDIKPIKAGKQRFYTSALYKAGEFEVNLFNNLFTEKSKKAVVDSNGVFQGYEKRKFTDRTTFNSTFIQLMFGVTPRINIGLDSRFRTVSYNASSSDDPLGVFKFENNPVDSTFSYSRVAFSALGPRVKYIPFKKYGNISVQHTLYFPTVKNSEAGNIGEKGWIDWKGLTLWNQMYYDQAIGDKFAIFAEVDLLLENFSTAWGNDEAGWQFSTPVTIIPSYFPNNSLVFYGLIGSAPQWWVAKDVNNPVQKNTLSYNPFNQYGLGFKYLITKNWQLELLYTEFFNAKPTVARTFNFGIRYIGKK